MEMIYKFEISGDNYVSQVLTTISEAEHLTKQASTTMQIPMDFRCLDLDLDLVQEPSYFIKISDIYKLFKYSKALEAMTPRSLDMAIRDTYLNGNYSDRKKLSYVCNDGTFLVCKKISILKIFLDWTIESYRKHNKDMDLFRNDRFTHSIII